jgi:hypothetical protein
VARERHAHVPQLHTQAAAAAARAHAVHVPILPLLPLLSQPAPWSTTALGWAVAAGWAGLPHPARRVGRWALALALDPGPACMPTTAGGSSGPRPAAQRRASGRLSKARPLWCTLHLSIHTGTAAPPTTSAQRGLATHWHLTAPRQRHLRAWEGQRAGRAGPSSTRGNYIPPIDRAAGPVNH